MGLGEYSIRTWEDIKTAFVWKYQEYWKPRDSRNDIFKIQQLEDESLEDYLESFNYVLHNSKYNDLREDAIWKLFLRGISEDLVETLNLMTSGDISHKTFAQICETCINYSRSRGKIGRNIWEPYNRNTKGNTSSSGRVTRIELGNLLENFKTDRLGAMGSQLDALQSNKGQEEDRASMSIFYPRCRTKHPQREFPLNNISICHICTEEHPTDNFPLFPGLQAIYKSGDVSETSRRPPWKPRD